MRRTLLVAAALTAMMVGALPAQADPPRTWLPEADLFCSTGVDPLTKVGDWTGNPSASTLWIREGDHAGHYVIVAIHHERDDSGPYDAPRTGLVAEPHGQKEGLDVSLACQVVSRWDLPGTEDDFTVFAPLELARVN